MKREPMIGDGVRVCKNSENEAARLDMRERAYSTPGEIQIAVSYVGKTEYGTVAGFMLPWAQVRFGPDGMCVREASWWTVRDVIDNGRILSC